MTAVNAMSDEPMPHEELEALATMQTTAACDHLRAAGRWEAATAMQLAAAALARADGSVATPTAWLAIAEVMAEDFTRPPAIIGPIAYAQARVAVQRGQLSDAETRLLAAQAAWQAAGDQAAVARSHLGLTQVLAMQGRYAEATAATDAAIAGLTGLTATDGHAWLLLARGQRNRATLLSYQEQHAAALDAYASARAALLTYARVVDTAEPAEVSAEMGHVALNEATAHTFLDAPAAATDALIDAIRLFDAAGDVAYRGRARTNLGRLYSRLGDYAAALAQFDQASEDLIDPAAVGDDDVEALRRADQLLLEHATVYVALNLLPEAEQSLARCERLFRASAQPYELAQTRYTQGLLWLRRGDVETARAALSEAAALFGTLENRYWGNLCRLALVHLAASSGEPGEAAALADALVPETVPSAPGGAVAWDVAGLAEYWLLRVQLALAAGQVAEAEGAVASLAELIGDEIPSPLPHLHLRLVHARGQVAAARGDVATARRLYSQAVDLVDAQRASLPFEEVRTAFLSDKMQVYTDLVLSLLDAPAPSDDAVAAAFAVVERARSRALLERLMASMDVSDARETPEIVGRREELRRQLHWLYNRLLGESGTRRLDGAMSRELVAHEAAIQKLEWRVSPVLAQVAPVVLADLQASLGHDQQALLYFVAGEELLAFVVGRAGAHVVRRLSRLDDVRAALAELRFQLGRVELGADYLARHQARLNASLRRGLERLYRLVVEPLRDLLQQRRLLITPYGPLHALPFHALWDGGRYLIEDFEVTYAPSASVAVHCATRRSDAVFRRFAGLAPRDPQIPQARAEVMAAARCFTEATALIGSDATQAGMRRVAADTDVLHLATHGLFRSDNAFFSSLKLADGWMDVREIYRLRLTARLVVLSACESGVGDVRGGDEVVGLARGFIAAGAETVIATLWNVHDQSATQLMARFYGDLQNEASAGKTVRPASALRAAQLAAVAAGQHPYYWAPFFVIG